MNTVQNFTLKSFNEPNEKWSLNHVANKPVMLTFWTSWCPDSLRDLQAKQVLYEKMNTDQLEMIMIHVTARDPEADLHTFLLKNKYTFPVILDEGRTIYDRFNCSGVPTTILLNKNHEIVRAYDEKATMIEIMQGISVILN